MIKRLNLTKFYPVNNTMYKSVHIVYFFMLVFSLFRLSSFEFLSSVASYAFSGSFVFGFIILIISYKERKFTKNDLVFFGSFFLLGFFYYFNEYILNASNFSYEGLQIFLLLFSCLLFRVIKWRSDLLKTFYFIFFLFNLLSYIFSLVNSDLSFFANPNGFAQSLFSCFALGIFVDKKHHKSLNYLINTSQIVCVYLIFTSGSRSVLISLGILWLTGILWKYITISKAIFNTYFFFIVAVFFAFVIYYSYSEIYSDSVLASLSEFYSEKSVFSGRERLWRIAFDFIYSSPLVGYGSSFNIYGLSTLVYFEHSLSVHNLYIQIMLQCGIIGVSLLLIGLFALYSSVYKYSMNFQSRFSAGIILAIISQQFFEVTLTQNNLPLGIFSWIAMFVAVNYSETSL
jgi:O-antigen ligase